MEMVDRSMKITTSEPTFLSFSELAQTISVTRGNHSKIKLCAQYLSKLDSDNLRRATQFFGEGAFSTVSGKRASVGHRTIAVLAAEFCEIDYDLVFRPSRTATVALQKPYRGYLRIYQKHRLNGLQII